MSQTHYPRRRGCEIKRAMIKMKPMSRDLCIICKGGKMLCGLNFCPVLERINAQIPIKEKLSDEIFGPSPSIFVGWRNYPDVFVGPLTSLDPDVADLSENPAKWYGNTYDAIIRMRSFLFRSKLRQNVKAMTRFVEKSREIALSYKPIDIEAILKKRPTLRLSFSPITQPMGPSSVIKDFKIVENPRIPRAVDYVVNDEMRASEGIFKLYRRGFDVYYLTNVLSSASLGIRENRKLVPTRWSITAVDDIIAKFLLEEIRNFQSIGEFLVFSNEYLHNHFEILFIPGRFEFELFEAWAPKTLWTLSHSKPVVQVEYEGFKGRTRYAEKEGGGYYAARIGIAEYLYRIRRQARVVVFREIYEGYIMPVGVWEVRENVRNALRKKPERFNSLNEALNSINSRLRVPIDKYLRMSEILTQKRITEYI